MSADSCRVDSPNQKLHHHNSAYDKTVFNAIESCLTFDFLLGIPFCCLIGTSLVELVEMVPSDSPLELLPMTSLTKVSWKGKGKLF